MRAVEFLISRGHSPQCILRPVREGGYTYNQFWALYQAAHKNSNDEYKRELFAYRVAQHATSKDFKKYIRDMDVKEKSSELKDKPVTQQSLRQLSHMLSGGK